MHRNDSGREQCVPLRCIPLQWPGGLKLPLRLRRVAAADATNARRATPSLDYDPVDDDVPTAADKRPDPHIVGEHTRARREVERELAAEVRARLDVIDERRSRKRTRLAREHDDQ